MRLRSSIAISLFGLCSMTFGQSGSGSIAGTLSGPAHNPVPGLAVEAKNIASGTYYKTTSSPKGEYTFAQLPAGSYEVSVLNVTFRPFVQKDVKLAAGGTQRVDIQLATENTGTTLGELQSYLMLAA